MYRSRCDCTAASVAVAAAAAVAAAVLNHCVYAAVTVEVDLLL